METYERESLTVIILKSIDYIANATSTLTMTVMEYEHIDGTCSVTGGYMWRGPKKKLKDSYYFGEYDYNGGNIWAGTEDVVNGSWTASIVVTKKSSGLFISSFGEDIHGNHYYVSDVIGNAKL
jgi:hypothetical protein